MKQFENRIALPEVVDEMHRETIAREIGSRGITLARPDWAEIERALEVDYTDELLLEKDWSKVCYDDAPLVGPFFDDKYYALHSSECAFYYISMPDTKTHLVNCEPFMREIYFNDPHQRQDQELTRMVFSPDSPPALVHGDDYHYVTHSLGAINPDSHSPFTWINKIEEAFGAGAVDRVSEQAAKSLITALRQSRKYLDVGVRF